MKLVPLLLPAVMLLEYMSLETVSEIFTLLMTYARQLRAVMTYNS